MGMPQLQLPLFPEGTTRITAEIACEWRDGKVTYVHGHLPVFQHAPEDVAAFRYCSSQLVVNGTVGQAEIARAFHVPQVTVKRSGKGFREGSGKDFFTPRRRRSASVLKGEVKEKAQALREEGKSVSEVAQALEVLPNTLHKAMRGGRLYQPKKRV